MGAGSSVSLKKAISNDDVAGNLFDDIDVNKDGKIPASKGPVLLRMLIGDSEVANGLQLQLGEQNMIQLDKKFRPNPI